MSHQWKTNVSGSDSSVGTKRASKRHILCCPMRTCSEMSTFKLKSWELLNFSNVQSDGFHSCSTWDHHYHHQSPVSSPINTLLLLLNIIPVCITVTAQSVTNGPSLPSLSELHHSSWHQFTHAISTQSQPRSKTSMSRVHLEASQEQTAHPLEIPAPVPKQTKPMLTAPRSPSSIPGICSLFN